MNLLKKVIAVMMLLPPCPSLYAWGGDGYLIPGRGKRVAARCENGHCAVHGTWRSHRQARAVSAHSYGYGSAGQHGYSSAGYGSAGQHGYGSAGQTSYGSAGQYGSAVYVPEGDARAVSGCENCDCENCSRLRAPKETTDAARDEFKDGLTSVDTFRRGLNSARIDNVDIARPMEMLASR